MQDATIQLRFSTTRMKGDQRIPRKRRLTRLHAGARLWLFLNSGFGIWLLSTVVVGLVSFGWTTWDARVSEERERTKAWRRLTTEMNARVSRASTMLNAKPQASVATVLVDCGIASPPAATVVYPEFRDRPLESLVWQQQELLKPDDVTERLQLTFYRALLLHFMGALERGQVTREDALLNLKNLRRPDPEYDGLRIRWDKKDRAFVQFGKTAEREWTD